MKLSWEPIANIPSEYLSARDVLLYAPNMRVSGPVLIGWWEATRQCWLSAADGTTVIYRPTHFAPYNLSTGLE